MKTIKITKNRGWRGLAEAVVLGDDHLPMMKTIFSFSQDIWNDMLKGIMVFETSDDYHIAHFNNTERLPKGQRSVLIKHFTGDITGITSINKHSTSTKTLDDHIALTHYLKNTNNHTTSAWNNVGIRVTYESINI